MSNYKFQSVEMMQDPINRNVKNKKSRGYTIYTTSQLMNTGARNKDGYWQAASIENPYFLISPEDRIRIVKMCSPILGIITSRMNRISGTNFVITQEKKEEDKIYNDLQQYYDIWTEYQSAKEIEYIIARSRLFAKIKTYLPDVLPDLSNFQQSALRWRKRLQISSVSRCDEIYNWLQEPNASTKWQDFIQQWVFDLMTHGASAVYKESLNEKIENIYNLAGGTTIPIRDVTLSAKNAYIQLVNMQEPQIFYPEELAYDTYIPISSQSYGLIPVEALLTKVSELLLFDKLSATGADSTKVPEKMIIINDASPFGGIDGDIKEIVPIAIGEQKRLEKKLNTPVQGGVITFTGNNATVIDLSRENLMSYYNGRQKDIREDVALVWNASNMEMNLSGSTDTSGRSTAEIQQEIDQGKGIIPIIKKLENTFTRYILPFRFGYGYQLKFELTKNRIEEIDYITKKANSGVYSIDEIRVNDLNEKPFGGEYSKPKGTVQPDGSQGAPFMTKVV